MPVQLLSGRFIAFLDILGFSKRLRTETLDVLHQRYASLIDQANATVFWTTNGTGDGARIPNFEYAGFLFDSVILVSRELDSQDAAGHAFNFVAATTQLMEQSFKRQLPLRGSIGLGNVLHDDDRRMLLSEAFPELVQSEKAQEWSGCTVQPTAEARIIELVVGADLGDHPKPATQDHLKTGH